MPVTSMLWEYLSFDVLLIVTVFLVSLAIALFVFVVGYLHYQHNLYEHIPGPPRDSFFSGNVSTIQKEIKENKKGVCEIWFDWHMQYGSVFVFWVYHTAILVVTDPELVKKVLITLNLPKAPRVYNVISYCFGERLAGQGILTELNHEVWKRKRALLNQAFHRTYLMNLMKAFNESCDVFLKKMGKLADGKTKVRMTDEFARVTLDVIGKVKLFCYIISGLNCRIKIC
jgi:cholesterol 24(S)-hydroxylase